jgi:hypothetical protein
VRVRTVLGLGVLGFVIAGLVAGRTRTITVPLHNTSAGVAWREVNVGRRQVCLPVAISLAARARGLAGVRHVLEPLVIENTPGLLAVISTRGTRVRLAGVWVDASGVVYGSWRSRPGRPRVVRSHGVTPLTVLFGPGERLWPAGSRVAVTSLSCNMETGL